MTRAVVSFAIVLAVITGASRRSAAEPSDRTLVLVGVGLAPPTYLLGVTLHEGSHAVMAKLVGATVDEIHLFPPGVDPKVNKFRFGWTYVHGLHDDSDRLWFYIAPKLTDTLLLGGFAALVFTDAWPRNRYGQLALTVLGTGLWVDFSKDVLAVSPTNDVMKVFDLWCIHGWRQIPARLVYASAVVGLGLIVARGYERTFDDSPTTSPRLMVPMVTGSF